MDGEMTPCECELCVWWVPNMKADGSWGECRISAPVSEHGWPRTHMSAGCGDGQHIRLPGVEWMERARIAVHNAREYSDGPDARTWKALEYWLERAEADLAEATKKEK